MKRAIQTRLVKLGRASRLTKASFDGSKIEFDNFVLRWN
jgi:hypothetical protein